MKKLILNLISFALLATPVFGLDLAPNAMPSDDTDSDAHSLRAVGAALRLAPVEGRFFGRIRSTMVYHNYTNDAIKYNYLDTTSDARLGYTVKSQAGEWMTSATIDYNIESADSKIEARYLFVTIENTEFSFRIGRQEPGGSTLGGRYLQNIDETLVIGETIGFGDYLTFRLKKPGLQLVVGRAAGGNVTGAEVIPNREEASALFWRTHLGEFDVSASVTNINEKVNVLAQSKNLAVHGAERYQSAAGAIQTPLGPGRLSLNFDRYKKAHLDTQASNINKQTDIFFYDLPFSPDDGLTLAYSKEKETDGSQYPTRFVSTDIGYTYSMGILRLYGAVNRTLLTDQDGGTNIKETQFGVGMGAFSNPCDKAQPAS